MAPSSSHQYVTFNLMGEEYALEIGHVREIIECERVTAIPSMPAVVRGVINLRGSVVPAVDLPVKFGLAETALEKGAYIVVVELKWTGESIRLGLVTTQLGRVIDVKKGDIKPVPDFGTRIQSEYLQGVAHVDGRLVLFLAAEHLLSPAELLRITALADGRMQTPSPADERAGEV
jgi:purine-binding chemotaxis protein CheW